MAKLYFRYGAMNCGKSTNLMQVAYNYKERGMESIVMKPKIDTKGDNKVVSRLGINKKNDMVIEKNTNIYNEVKELGRYYSSSYEIILNNLEKLRGLLTAETDYLQELNLQERVINYANRIIKKISGYNYMGIFASITNFGMIIVLIPFVLFYLLKDDEKIYKNFMRIIPKEKKKKTEDLLTEIDQALSTFISSQLVVALLLGIVMLVGFLIIGLPNAITLALIAMITSLVPIIGPIIGSLPALFVALSKGFVMIFGVGIVLLIAQYLEGNLIRPFVQGKRLEIHPLVVLFVVLAAVYLFGFIGALTAVPIYVIIRLIFKRKYLPEI